VSWAECRFLSCSVLPVARACQCECSFCFSRSSISAEPRGRARWRRDALAAHYRWARDRGATRLVVTGGGEPLLDADTTVDAVRLGHEVWDEVTCFSNAALLDGALVGRLVDAGLSYLCWSRHHWDDARNRDVMGAAAPALAEVAARCAGLRLRATCVMYQGGVATADDCRRYIDALRPLGVREFTFKHTYVAYERSLFRASAQDAWCRERQVGGDLFEGEGEVVSALPWGPRVRDIDGVRVCFYEEPTPRWELQHRLCRSSNLLSDGSVHASLEDTQSLLYRLDGSPTSSLRVM
jgi:pyruvate-formate lyase-activating enzyme